MAMETDTLARVRAPLPAMDAYPSRLDPEPRILPRLDPVVHGGPVIHGGAIIHGGIEGEARDPGVGPLSREDLQAFEKDGYLFLPGLIPEREIAAYATELRKLAAAGTNGPEYIREPGGGEVRSIFRVHLDNAVFLRLSRDERLAGIARRILGGDVYIHQSRVNLKPGFAGKEFYWHSDFETWHVEDGMPRMRALSCSVNLTENFPTNGAVMVIPGSHRHFVACVGETPAEHYKQSLRRQEYGVPDKRILAELAGERGIECPVGPAGSVLFFDCNLLHGSNSNITPFPRHNAFFVYNSVENRLGDPFGRIPPRPEFIAARRDADPIP